MKVVKKIWFLSAVFCMLMVCLQAPAAAAETDNWQVHIEDITAQPGTVSGQARAKVSVEGIEGDFLTFEARFSVEAQENMKMSVSYLFNTDEITGNPPPLTETGTQEATFPLLWHTNPDVSDAIHLDGTEQDVAIITFDGTEGAQVSLESVELIASRVGSNSGLENFEKAFGASGESVDLTVSNSDNAGGNAIITLVMDQVRGFSNRENLNTNLYVKMTSQAGESSEVQLSNVPLTQGGNLDTTQSTTTYVVERENILAGKYEIEISGNGYFTYATTLDVRSGEDNELTVTNAEFKPGNVTDDSSVTTVGLREYAAVMSALKLKSGQDEAIAPSVDFNRDGVIDDSDLEAIKYVIEEDLK